MKYQEHPQHCGKTSLKDRNLQNKNKGLRVSSGKKRRRHRTAFTPTQLLGLENSFERGHYLVGDERKQLAVFLRLSETQIKVTFKNCLRIITVSSINNKAVKDYNCYLHISKKL